MNTIPPGDAGLRAWYDAAAAQPADTRDAWLDTHCPDVTLRTQVRAMLTDGDVPDAWLDGLHAHFAATDHATGAFGHDTWSGRVIGDYRLDQCVGEGGMSVVYRATALREGRPPVVAIKILRVELHADERQKAFRREREALSKLDHPNIARLIDGGVLDGTPYLVIDYIVGKPLTDHARSHRLDLKARLRLFATMCHAVEIAHRNLIVHRDLKPSNVLVTDDGQVKLLDFGIAKLLDTDEPTTRTARIALTPDYAAPEQFTHDQVSTATDVFALGVILHELLTGVRPERGWTTRPSVIVGRMADTDLPAGLTVRPLRADLAGDLDNVILMAIDPDPQRRYGSAGRLGEDVERHLAGLPVLAHPPSRWYRTRKFVQRHRGAVGLTVLLGLGLIASLGIAVREGRNAHEQARIALAASAAAKRESARANAVRDYMVDLFAQANPDRPIDQRIDMMTLVETAADSLPESLQNDPATQAELLLAVGDVLGNWRRVIASERVMRRAHAVSAALPPTDSTRMHVTLEFARALNRAMKYDEARATLNALLDTPSDAFPDDMPRWMVQKALMAVLASSGEHATAIALGPSMMRGYRDDCARGVRCAELGIAASDLAFINAGDGRYGDALALFDEAVRLKQQHHVADNSLLNTTSGLGDIAWIMGDYARAHAAAQETARMATSVYGASHVLVPMFRLDVARTELTLHGPDAATAILRSNRLRDDKNINADCDLLAEWTIWSEWRWRTIRDDPDMPPFPEASVQRCRSSQDVRLWWVARLLFEADRQPAHRHEFLASAEALRGALEHTIPSTDLRLDAAIARESHRAQAWPIAAAAAARWLRTMRTGQLPERSLPSLEARLIALAAAHTGHAESAVPVEWHALATAILALPPSAERQRVQSELLQAH